MDVIVLFMICWVLPDFCSWAFREILYLYCVLLFIVLKLNIFFLVRAQIEYTKAEIGCKMFHSTYT